MKKITECYLVIIYLIAGTILSGCKKENVPTVRTTPVSDITGVNATSGGTITDEGSSSIIIRGVCWSTDVNPTIADNKTIDGRGKGSFSSNITGLNVDVVYYIRAYAANSVGTGYGRVVSFISYGQSPTATTSSVTNIEATTATLIGNVVANNLSTVVTLEYGTTTSYGTTVTAAQSPLTGVTTSSVNADIAGLTEATIYHFRVKAVNSLGTTYGSDLTFTTLLADVEGNTYNTINIGTQVWMAENLKTTKYNDGTPIPNITDNTTWIALTTGAYSDYSNTPANSITYGRLYNWYVVDNNAATKVASNGGRNVCPTSWHVPSDAEWTTLTTYLGGESIAGDKLKESGTAHWASPNTGATNETGFTALPGGNRGGDGLYYIIGNYGFWWSSTEYSTWYAWKRNMHYDGTSVNRANDIKVLGYSVRCVRDF